MKWWRIQYSSRTPVVIDITSTVNKLYTKVQSNWTLELIKHHYVVGKRESSLRGLIRLSGQYTSRTRVVEFSILWNNDNSYKRYIGSDVLSEPQNRWCDSCVWLWYLGASANEFVSRYSERYGIAAALYVAKMQFCKMQKKKYFILLIAPFYDTNLNNFTFQFTNWKVKLK